MSFGRVIVESIQAGVNILGAIKDAGPSWTSLMGGTAQVCFTSADATANPALTPSPGAGLKLVITDMVISCAVAMSLTFTEETTGTVLLVVYVPANGTLQITPRGKFKLNTAAKKLMVDASVAGAVAIQYWYYTEA